MVVLLLIIVTENTQITMPISGFRVDNILFSRRQLKPHLLIYLLLS